MVKNLLSQRKHTGDIAPRHSHSERNSHFTRQYGQQTKALIVRQTDATLREIGEKLDVDFTLPAIMIF